jgi:ribonuclease HI
MILIEKYLSAYGNSGAEVQVKGFPGAVYKGFTTRFEAEDFLKKKAGKKPKAKSKSTYRNKSKPIVKSSSERTNSNLKGNTITIYTDGGCINNPGPGGYGVVIKNKKRTKELSGGYRLTTNNRMELSACIVALSDLKKSSSVLLYSDSKYVVDGISKGWAEKWRSNNWMRNKTEAAINPDLWGQLLDLCKKHEVEFKWVKGHSGNKWNEWCDQLASMEAAKRKLPADKIYENLNL